LAEGGPWSVRIASMGVSDDEGNSTEVRNSSC
jgi:hypothetical protein